MALVRTENNEKKLTENKHAFLKGENFDPYQLDAKDYPALITHYQKKYGFKKTTFVINGETEFGKNCIKDAKLYYNHKINQYKDPNLKYALLVAQYWVPPESHYPELKPNTIKRPSSYGYLNSKDENGSDFAAYYPELFDAIKGDFLERDGKFKKCDADELARLNAICSQLKCREKLDEYIVASAIQKNEKYKEIVCLTKKEALQEMNQIQEQLRKEKKDNKIVYLFTNGVNEGQKHFEIFIITRHYILKPVHWNLDDTNSIVSPNELNTMFHTDLKCFISPTTKTQQPQADRVSCGTLGLLYVKELLKNDEDQLNRLTLVFSAYRLKNQFQAHELIHIFFPSPQTLRYTQNSFHNLILRAMMEDEYEVEIAYREKTYKVQTLKNILETSIDIANSIPDKECASQNKKMLKNLNTFRMEWIAEYDAMEENRATMNAEDKRNMYLTYCSQRMEKHKNAIDMSKSNSDKEDSEIKEVKKVSKQQPLSLMGHYRKRKPKQRGNLQDMWAEHSAEEESGNKETVEEKRESTSKKQSSLFGSIRIKGISLKKKSTTEDESLKRASAKSIKVDDTDDSQVAKAESSVEKTETAEEKTESISKKSSSKFGSIRKGSLRLKKFLGGHMTEEELQAIEKASKVDEAETKEKKSASRKTYSFKFYTIATDEEIEERKKNEKEEKEEKREHKPSK